VRKAFTALHGSKLAACGTVENQVVSALVKWVTMTRFTEIKVFIYALLILSIFGCGWRRGSPGPVQSTDPKTKQEIAAEKALELMAESIQLESSAQLKSKDKSLVWTRSRSEAWNHAVDYWRKGDIEQTATQMKQYVELNPENATAHNIIGLDYYTKELYGAALDEFQIAVELDPDEPQYSYNKALTLVMLERYDEAEEALERTTGLKEGEYLRQVYADLIPLNRARELYNAGCDAMKKSDRIRAIDLFRSALRIRPDMVEAYVNLGVLYRTWGDEKRQIRYFGDAVKLRPDAPHIRYNLGLAYFDAKMYPQAIEEFTRATKLDPYHRMAHFKLGMTFFMTQNYSDALTEFQKCLKIYPNWFDARLNLGTCYLKTGNVDGAIEQFEKAIELRPSSAEAHYNLGEAYMRMKEFDKTANLFQKALEIDPGHKQAQLRLKELETYRGE
jgi:tetratricopeptide (TPR) repeat protein